MKLRVIALGILVGVVALSCGGTGSSKNCGAANCATGCCDALGVCQPGTSTSDCGGAGAACRVCPSTQVCRLNSCAAAGAGGGGVGVGGGGFGVGGGGVGGGGGSGGGSGLTGDGGTILGDVNGVTVVTEAQVARKMTTSTLIGMGGSRSTPFAEFILVMTAAPGVYSCGTGGLIYYFESGNFNATNATGGYCTITVNSYGTVGQQIQGTFSGYLPAFDGGTPVTITNGFFDVLRGADQ